jgi:hypothetical protein
MPRNGAITSEKRGAPLLCLWHGEIGGHPTVELCCHVRASARRQVDNTATMLSPRQTPQHNPDLVSVWGTAAEGTGLQDGCAGNL